MSTNKRRSKMEKTIDELLSEVMKTELKEIQTNKGTQEEKKTRLEKFGKLNGIVSMRQETRNKEQEVRLKFIIDENEEIHKSEEVKLRLKSDKLETVMQVVKVGVEVFGIILPVIFYSSWMHKGFDFEKEGTYTSQTFKGLFGKFKPTR